MRRLVLCLIILGIGFLFAIGGNAQNPVSGAAEYGQKCAGCHGQSGGGNSAPALIGCTVCNDFDALAAKIDADMPAANPANCVGQCALDTAAYIFVDFNGNTLPEESNKIYYPHVASGGIWETEIGAINSSAVQVEATLQAYDGAGAMVGSAMDITLNAGGRRRMTVGSEFTNPADIRYIVLETQSDGITGYTKFFSNGRFRVAVPAVTEENTGDLLVSHIASDTSWWTGITFVNTTSAAASMSIQFSNNETRTVDLPAGGHTAFLVKDLFGGQAQPGIESAVVTNAGGIIGLELFGSEAAIDSNYLSGILLRDDSATTMYYPHIVGGDDWWTGIVAYNPPGAAADVTLTTYSTAGAVLSSAPISIPSGGKFIGTDISLNLPAQTAWFRLESNTAITGFELFGKQDGSQLAGYTGVGIAGASGIFPKLETSGWTGVAFVNTTNQTNAVTLTATDDAGTAIATAVISLGAFEKVVDLAGGLFDTDISAATYIAYSAQQDVAGFQINGSDDDMMLDALPGLRAGAVAP